MFSEWCCWNDNQSISTEHLADDYLSTLLTGNVMKFPVHLTKIFNSVSSVLIELYYDIFTTASDLIPNIFKKNIYS